MKAIVVEDFGESSVLELKEVADLTPSKGQIVVKIHAAGVNPVETYRRSGTPPYDLGPLPYTPGSDGAGEVVAVDSEVTKWKVGDRVYLFAPKGSGTYAEYCLCDENSAFRLPDNISFEQGAALGIPYATAHRALFGKANVQAGEFVFIHGATGGVGVAAIQLALVHGCKVGGSAGSSQGEAFLESLGVRYTTNHHTPDYMSDVLGMTCGRGCDVILEMLANVNLNADAQVVAPYGRIVVIGNRGKTEVNPRDWMSRELSIHAMTLFNTPAPQLQDIYADLTVKLESGVLKPIISSSFSLEDAPKAHDAISRSGKFGKVVLVPHN
jgi:NADPH2:quinone reductase